MRRLLVISAAIHVGVLIVLPILPTLGNEQPLALEVYAVELVELPAPAPPAQEAVEEEAAPEPVVEAPPPEEKPIPEEPVRQRQRPVVTPPPRQPEKTLEEKIAERLKSQENSRPREESREERPVQQPSGSTRITAGKVADYYLTILQGKITRNWKQPSARFTGGEAITVRVSFTILRNGDVTGLRVARASGWSTVDQSAVQAVRTSAPFGALPPTYRDDRLDVTIDFTVTQ